MLADIDVKLTDKQRKELLQQGLTSSVDFCGDQTYIPPTSPIPTAISENPYHTPHNKYPILRDRIHFHFKSSSPATFVHWAKPVQELSDDVGVPMACWGADITLGCRFAI